MEPARLVGGNVGVLFTTSARWRKGRSKPFNDSKLNNSYALLAKKGKQHGINIILAHYREFSNSILKKAWIYDLGWKKIPNIEIDFVYSRFNRAVFSDHKKYMRAEAVKYRILENDIGMINHPDLEEFCWDKSMVHELFPEFTPRTFLVNSRRGLNVVLPAIKSEKVVIKPRYGTLGGKVLIIDKKNIPKEISKNTIVQEFIDTSNGIKGLVKSYHDLRVVIINGKIDHAHIRVPKKGLLTANMAKGGKKIFISNGQIPKKVRKIARKVDRLLRRYKPRVYSIDFLFDEKQNPHIVECNSSPVIQRYAFGKYRMPEFYDRLLAAIKSGIKVRVAVKY
jgi:glutathione synthase/RimK-type ligase-like ATP-grasp enzyme